MKKKSNKSRKARAKTQDVAPKAAAPASLDRRRALTWLRNGAIALPFLGAGGYFSARAVQASIAELDLTKVGTGTPSIVQIHDPNCQLCQTLQRQTRRALRAHDEAELHYLVANINTAEGNEFAGRYGVPHVTLLFFDADGEMVHTLRGPTTPEIVADTIANHVTRYVNR